MVTDQLTRVPLRNRILGHTLHLLRQATEVMRATETAQTCDNTRETAAGRQVRHHRRNTQIQTTRLVEGMITMFNLWKQA